MPSYTAFIKAVTLNEWGVEPSGEAALKCVRKETLEPANPATTPKLKSAATKGLKVEGSFEVPTLANGELVTAAAIHASIKGSVNSLVKVAFKLPQVSATQGTTTTQQWV